MVLTDDNFATIVAAVEAGPARLRQRPQVHHSTSSRTPRPRSFRSWSSRCPAGAIPLPLTALQILAIDLGTETLPALALGREPAEPGLMDRPPRQRGQRLIDRAMLVRAWAVLGLCRGGAGHRRLLLGRCCARGWIPATRPAPGTPLHDAYLQATTMTFAGIVACQVGTALRGPHRPRLAARRSACSPTRCCCGGSPSSSSSPPP